MTSSERHAFLRGIQACRDAVLSVLDAAQTLDNIPETNKAMLREIRAHVAQIDAFKMARRADDPSGAK